jgi:hypothetical protein
MGDHVGAIRHMAFLVQHMFPSLRDVERAELCQQLGALTARAAQAGGGTPVPHGVDAGFILPPVNIYTVPRVENLRPLPPAEPLLEPSGDGPVDAGPFIFTPIQSTSAGGKGSRGKPVTWVQGEVAGIEVKLHNPLAVELKVQEMSILHDGAPFDALPSSFVLAPGATQTVKLSGIPREAGEMKVSGYTVTAFGVRSTCRLKPLGLEEVIKVKFCPALPKLELSVMGEDPPAPGESVRVEVFHGESAEVRLALLNASSLAVECFEASLQGAPIRHRNNVSLDADAAQRIEPGEKAVVAVTVNGPPTKCCRLVADDVAAQDEQEQRILQELRCEDFTMRTVAKYSGSTDSSKGYSRRVSQALAVTVRPSVTVTQWDVLPGETANECYVILDVLSAFEASECEILYAEGKKVALDAGSRCRIPLPVAKVSCESATQSPARFLATYLDEHIDLRWRLPNPQHQNNQTAESAKEDLEEGAATCPVDPGPLVGRSGRISLSGLELDERMVSLLELSRVFWSVSVNGEKWGGADFSLSAGQPTVVTLTVENRSEEVLRCSMAVSAFYVDADDGARGAKPRPVPSSLGKGGRRRQCQPGDSASHRATLVPPTPGQLRVKCSCEAVADASGRIDFISIPEFFVNLS